MSTKVCGKTNYYAFWSYPTLQQSERLTCSATAWYFSPNSIALAGRGNGLWIEEGVRRHEEKRRMAVDLPPNFFPFYQPEDPTGIRGIIYNNLATTTMAVYTFCGLHVAVLVVAKRYARQGKTWRSPKSLNYPTQEP